MNSRLRQLKILLGEFNGRTYSQSEITKSGQWQKAESKIKEFLDMTFRLFTGHGQGGQRMERMQERR